MKIVLCMKLINFLVVFSTIIVSGWGEVNNGPREISFKSVKSYYSDEINSPYFFASILDVCKNSKYIYISDWKNNKIKIFDHELKYISEFGKKGEGPGEFKQIFTDLKCDENSIYLSTISNIHIFDKKGSFNNRISIDVFPINEIYLLKDGFVLYGGSLDFAFYKTDVRFKITNKFYKMQKLKSLKCNHFFVFPNAFLTSSKRFLMFSRFDYNIEVYDLKKKRVIKSVKRNINYGKVKCEKQKFKGVEYYMPKGGYSYMLEDSNYYYYFYSDANYLKRVDVYGKNFVLKWSGKYKEDVYLLMAGYKKDKFIGIHRDESDVLEVFDLIKRIK